MKKRLLFCSFVGILTACQREGDIQPTLTTLTGEVVGTYRTNFYLDPSIALSSGQLPYAEIKAESDSTVTLVIHRPAPAQTDWTIQHVSLSRQSTNIQLNVGSSTIATLQNDRVFTSNGMEKEGKLLRITLQDGSESTLSFSGAKQ
ncbi:hypothetical protein [Spirosoma fluviale]|uniref:Lipocalin-like domain-containing protein n=1 Tax=Spirosoma fluviale TaxID=1597977 RepID=A0A286GLL8_9BACT|nr:hypothetical protein [Spirosoma fluviale]SOD95874.1 hypothetical protein SAMN06269250_5025 [Spirosoma fluviale]